MRIAKLYVTLVIQIFKLKTYVTWNRKFSILIKDVAKGQSQK